MRFGLNTQQLMMVSLFALAGLNVSLNPQNQTRQFRHPATDEPNHAELASEENRDVFDLAKVTGEEADKGIMVEQTRTSDGKVHVRVSDQRAAVNKSQAEGQPICIACLNNSSLEVEKDSRPLPEIRKTVGELVKAELAKQVQQNHPMIIDPTKDSNSSTCYKAEARDELDCLSSEYAEELKPLCTSGIPRTQTECMINLKTWFQKNAKPALIAGLGRETSQEQALKLRRTLMTTLPNDEKGDFIRTELIQATKAGLIEAARQYYIEQSQSGVKPAEALGATKEFLRRKLTNEFGGELCRALRPSDSANPSMNPSFNPSLNPSMTPSLGPSLSSCVAIPEPNSDASAKMKVLYSERERNAHPSPLMAKFIEMEGYFKDLSCAPDNLFTRELSNQSAQRQPLPKCYNPVAGNWGVSMPSAKPNANSKPVNTGSRATKSPVPGIGQGPYTQAAPQASGQPDVQQNSAKQPILPRAAGSQQVNPPSPDPL
ncbi:MAG: hypothetical protein C5B49_02095 [Bdellovibrio sp.]|nr:MAG: hypothetical protein C5B49_02095 [Bdellovibrio sp.]